jgi:hypothetical protein
MSQTSMHLGLDLTVEHNARHAAFLGRACELAYLPAEQGVAEFRNQLRLQAELISQQNTQVYVALDENAVVVAFRGSESFFTLDGFRDWLLTNARNFLILPEGQLGTDFAAAGVGARFHSGFMSALAEIWQPLFEKVDTEFSKKERPVWITGHSLGGALALLCGWRFHQHFINVHQICTFGAPMIGNDAAAAAFLREFPDKVFRYVDVGDIVPRLPTVSLFSNSYQHCQREIILGNQADLTLKQKLENLAEQTEDGAINEVVESSLWSEIRQGMPSHMMNNYLNCLLSKQ